MRRIGWGLLLGSLLALAGCGLNPQPEPPGGTDGRGAGGAPGSGGASGAAGMGAYPGAGGSKGGVTAGEGAGGGGAFPGGYNPAMPGPLCSDGTKPVACPPPGDGAQGKDNDERQGVRYMALGGLVTDLVTGLVWQRGELEGSLSAGEAEAHCAGATVDGQTGFRLPSRLELLTLVDYNKAGLAIDLVSFPDAKPAGYWTATPSGSSGQWSIDFAGGAAEIAEPSGSLATRCVMGAPYPENAAPTLAGGGASEAGGASLAWQQAPLAGLYGWAEAKAACAAVTDAGGGWRLPTEKELEALVDDSRTMPALPPGLSAPYDEPSGGVFWSSTSVASDASQAWGVDFAVGVTHAGPVSEPLHVRCVR